MLKVDVNGSFACPSCGEQNFSGRRCDDALRQTDPPTQSAILAVRDCERRAKERALTEVAGLRQELAVVQEMLTESFRIAFTAGAPPHSTLEEAMEHVVRAPQKEVAELRRQLAEAKKPLWLHSNDGDVLWSGGKAVAHLRKTPKKGWGWGDGYANDSLHGTTYHYGRGGTEREAKAMAEKACGVETVK